MGPTSYPMVTTLYSVCNTTGHFFPLRRTESTETSIGFIYQIAIRWRNSEILSIFLLRRSREHLFSFTADVNDATEEAVGARITEPTSVYNGSYGHDDRSRFACWLHDVPKQACTFVFLLRQADE
ncbi:hypothetical protein NE237_011366 [Protea cynaroides]|uniref:Uncharacterized protein n=1 Tax=Protea cynaroides TaxID=273540 RepID=A0A9Q0GVI4_9MAGN|nr:hypothetical protein NE237_011366 [Protea cynaroides]